MSDSAGQVEPERLHRRRASHLYGLIISGSVLAAAPVEFGLGRVAAAVVFTLTVYWVAESYAHWIAARTVHRRDLTRDEQRTVLADGLPLVASCLVPVGVLLVEAALGVQTKVGVDVALVVNVVLLVVVGWRMGRAGGLRGVRLVLSALVTGLLGVVMIVLKHALH
ncbi:hypothetical protein [Cellulomonas persica]|uniref:hypothetical protein n=1 Tax=Cellulomonas persica TaxID=76861 RepID=UPI0011BDBC4A|nr:hypothetical protein [Cellulomonas persica]